MKNRLKRSLARKSRWRHILLAIKPRYLGNYESQIKRCNGSLSGIHARSFRIRHEKSPEAPPSGEITMRSNLFAIKPRYVGNYASQMESYYGTLSGSHGRSFRIRHEKSSDAPLSGEITMMSHPACNRTSLSRKLCITDIMLLWNSIRKSWLLFQNPSWKIDWSSP